MKTTGYRRIKVYDDWTDKSTTGIYQVVIEDGEVISRDTFPIRMEWEPGESLKFIDGVEEAWQNPVLTDVDVKYVIPF